MTELPPEQREEAVRLADELLNNIPWCPWKPNPKINKETGEVVGYGPQQLFLLDFGREALYGGAAGGGKSIALLMAASQFLHVPGYAALLLRKRFPDLTKPKALMDIAQNWWAPHKDRGVKLDTANHTWIFPCPGGGTSQVVFGYLDTILDKYNYQGGAYQFCVAGETPVFMADGTWKPIRKVCVGDLVETLEGPRPVSRTWSLGPKPVTRLVTQHGHSILTGPGHRVLSLDELPPEPTPKPPLTHSEPSGSSCRSAQGSPPRRGNSAVGPGLCPEPCEPGLRGSWLQVTSSSSKDNQTGSEGSGGSRRAPSPPQGWSVRLALHEPALLSDPRGRSVECLRRECGHGQDVASPLGSPTGCHGEHGSGGEPLHWDPATVPSDIPPPGDAGVLADRDGTDGPTRIPAHIPGDSFCYAHPYTTEATVARRNVSSAWARMAPAGEAECFDLTVAGASHYIVSGGIVSANCGFDEVQEHRQGDYQFLFSRMRREADPDNPLSRVPIRMRATANPGGPGHRWTYERWVVPYKKWKAGGEKPKRNFYPALISDNQKLDEEDYVQSLMELDPVTRAQLMRGDWEIRPEARMFKREWFRPIAYRDLPETLAYVRYWDMASTEEDPAKEQVRGGPDWTVGCLVGRGHNGAHYIVDVRRWREEPAVNDLRLAATAFHDTSRVPQVMEQEPGSSGKAAVHHYRTTAFAGMNFRGMPSTGSKVVRAGPVASLASQRQVFYVVDGMWDPELFFDELEAFPDPSVHDDQVDSLSGAFLVLARQHIGKVHLGEHMNEEFRRENPWRPDVGWVMDNGDVGRARIDAARLTEKQIRDQIRRGWAV